MRHTILLCLFSVCFSSAFAQWTTSGTNIYNSNTGNIGIGTTSPGAKLDIASTYSGGTGDFTNITGAQLRLQATSGYVRVPHLSANGSISVVYNYQTGKDVYWGESSDVGNYFFRGRNFMISNGNMEMGSGNVLLPLEKAVGHVISTDNFAYDGKTVGNYSLGWYNDSWLSGASSAYLSAYAGLKIFTEGSVKFAITHDGKVGIGTTLPDTKLAVKGSIHAEEVKVDLNVPGPDYVFAADYKLPSLTEVAAYIKANKHLPEVPAAVEMEKNGVNVGEMNMLLLKKIEELTLYMIELKEENKMMKQEIEALKAK